MKLLIMSDTHGDADIIQNVIGHAEPVDAIFHCGDSELPADHPALKDIYIVRGNCDWDQVYPVETITELNGIKVYMTHGHLYNVKSTLMPLSYRAEEAGADIALFGHSHMLGAELHNGILFLNPGSLKQPRGRTEKSYAVIEIIGNKREIRFFNEGHKLIEKINF